MISSPQASGVFVMDEVLRNSNVVVVDDTPSNVELLERLLKAAGIERVRSFTEPEAALEDCRSLRPDLILLDLHMPRMDGFAFLDAVFELPPPGVFLPVIVLTADVTTEAKRLALSAGAKDFLTKPFDRTEVVLRVRNLLETQALYRHLEGHNAVLQATVDAQSASARATAAERRRRLDRIEAVLAGEGLGMVYQPIADLITGQVVGVEALARFSPEPRRPPDQWFAEAAEVGRGVQLEVAAVAAAFASMDQVPPGGFMAVNVSAATATSEALGQLLSSTQGARVALELTEHARVDDYSALINSLSEHRRLGVRLAVDDTGAGYAGFQHILRLHPDILKLDAVLTRGIDADPARRSLATALVTFAKEIDARIIAEGVETERELAVLQQIGIPWAQGFYLGRPGSLPPPTH